jgi:hypothetical protein
MVAQVGRGPLDGGWLVTGAGGERLYALQLVDEGYGTLDGAWRVAEGAAPRSGFFATASRFGGPLVLRFAERPGAPVSTLTLNFPHRSRPPSFPVARFLPLPDSSLFSLPGGGRSSVGASWSGQGSPPTPGPPPPVAPSPPAPQPPAITAVPPGRPRRPGRPPWPWGQPATGATPAAPHPPPRGAGPPPPCEHTRAPPPPTADIPATPPARPVHPPLPASGQPTAPVGRSRAASHSQPSDSTPPMLWSRPNTATPGHQAETHEKHMT